MPVNKRLTNQFIKIWRNVQQIEYTELLKMSIKEKFNKTLSIINMGFVLTTANKKNDDPETQKVMHRWVMLKNTLS